MWVEVENHIRAGASVPNRGASVMFPRFESREVSHSRRPRQRKPSRTTPRLTGVGIGALATAARAGPTGGPGWCLAHLVWSATTLVRAAVPSESAATVHSRDRFPSSSPRPGGRASTGMLIRTRPGRRRAGAFHRAIARISAAMSKSLTVKRGPCTGRGAAGTPGQPSKTKP